MSTKQTAAGLGGYSRREDRPTLGSDGAELRFLTIENVGGASGHPTERDGSNDLLLEARGDIGPLVTAALGAHTRVPAILPRYVGHLRTLRHGSEDTAGDARTIGPRVPSGREVEAVPVSSVRGALRGGPKG